VQIGQDHVGRELGDGMTEQAGLVQLGHNPDLRQRGDPLAQVGPLSRVAAEEYRSYRLCHRISIRKGNVNRREVEAGRRSPLFRFPLGHFLRSLWNVLPGHASASGPRTAELAAPTADYRPPGATPEVFPARRGRIDPGAFRADPKSRPAVVSRHAP